MTIRTFWTILLKLLGIYMVVSSLAVLPSFLFSVATVSISYSAADYVHIISLTLLTLGIYLLILRLFVFNPTWLIDKLHLERGFGEERIEVDLTYTTLLTIAIVIIGGFWFIENLTDFCVGLFTFFQQKAMFKDYSNAGWIIFSLLNAVIGYLVMTNGRPIVAFIEKQTNEKETKHEE